MLLLSLTPHSGLGEELFSGVIWDGVKNIFTEFAREEEGSIHQIRKLNSALNKSANPKLAQNCSNENSPTQLQILN